MAFPRANPAGDVQQPPPCLRLIGCGLSAAARQHRCRWPRAGLRRDPRFPIGRWDHIRQTQCANGFEQVADLEWFGQVRDAVGKHADGSAGDHQAPPGRSRVLRPELFNEVDAPLRAEIGVDKHRVVPGRVHAARLGERGRDIDLIAAGAERAADQGPHLVNVIDDQDPLAT